MNEAQLALMRTLLPMEELSRAIEVYSYSLPNRAVTFTNEDHLIREVTSSGSHYFDQATMRAFGSKINELYGGRFLVTSDRHPDGRLYRVVYFYEPSPGVCLSAEKLGWYMGSGALQKARNLAKLLNQTFPAE